ncbi:hypothetical protein [Alkalibacillus salilacus]|uniref:Cation transport ATPase n=1 Tax=Alkalibacillus salilacus TaxID=284582 RepID=A0ABT9VAY7_9BACI|nr:hypothetical protein [Alkalibacillus salilacus]MDQ0158101.1 cation transport ATPase [Alkalibacillus salilacus]
MKDYFHMYLKSLKKNFMLVIIALVLLIPTFFIWAGIPIFIIGGAVENLTTNSSLIYLSVSLSGGFLFSLYFLPFNLKVARNMASAMRYNMVKTFVYIQIFIITVSAVMFGIATTLIFS